MDTGRRSLHQRLADPYMCRLLNVAQVVGLSITLIFGLAWIAIRVSEARERVDIHAVEVATTLEEHRQRVYQDHQDILDRLGRIEAMLADAPPQP